MPRKKKGNGAAVGLAPGELGEGERPAEVEELEEAIARDGGSPLTAYRDPFGGRWIVLAALPLDRVQATPYQRELSAPHADRLAAVIPKVGRFLDPIIAVREGDGYWTPNGMHRLEAMRRLGAKTVTALVIPEHEVAFRILALNTEKAHNLKDKALETIRMARGLAEIVNGGERPESDFAFEFEEPAYLTLGVCYEERPRFSGGAYLPVLKRCDGFLDEPIGEALEVRRSRAERVLAVDDEVASIVERLKAAGLKSAYLKPFVVARINPLRFSRAAKPGQRAPRSDFDGTLEKMLAAAAKFDPGKVRSQDLAAMGGAPTMEE